MKKLIAGLAVAALLPLSAPVMAKDICLSSPGLGYIKLKAVKSLKPAKTTKVVPLIGVVNFGGLNGALVGSAVVLADGSVNYGWSGYTMGASTNNIDVVVSGANNLLEGSGYYDNNGNMTADGSVVFSAVDCKTLPAI